MKPLRYEIADKYDTLAIPDSYWNVSSTVLKIESELMVIADIRLEIGVYLNGIYSL